MGEHVMNEMQNAHIASNQDTANLRLRAALDDGEESGDYATAVPLFQELVQGGQLSLGGVLSVMELMLAEKISQASRYVALCSTFLFCWGADVLFGGFDECQRPTFDRIGCSSGCETYPCSLLSCHSRSY